MHGSPSPHNSPSIIPALQDLFCLFLVHNIGIETTKNISERSVCRKCSTRKRPTPFSKLLKNFFIAVWLLIPVGLFYRHIKLLRTSHRPLVACQNDSSLCLQSLLAFKYKCITRILYKMFSPRIVEHK